MLTSPLALSPSRPRCSNLHTEILDVPDFFWKDGELFEGDYKLVSAYPFCTLLRPSSLHFLVLLLPIFPLL